MSTRSFAISTSAKEDSTRPRFGALASAAGGGVGHGAAGSFVISIEGANGAEPRRCAPRAGGSRRRRRRRGWRRGPPRRAAAVAASSLSLALSASAHFRVRFRVDLHDVVLRARVRGEVDDHGLVVTLSGDDRLVVPAADVLRVVPCATSVCRSRRAWAYSVACHSGEVSSGMPAFSHRTYARMPTRSSGISTRETSTSGTRSPGGRGGSSARGAEENIARNGHRADRRRSGRARGRDVLPVEVARTATDVRLACARGATGGGARARPPRARGGRTRRERQRRGRRSRRS